MQKNCLLGGLGIMMSFLKTMEMEELWILKWHPQPPVIEPNNIGMLWEKMGGLPVFPTRNSSLFDSDLNWTELCEERFIPVCSPTKGLNVAPKRDPPTSCSTTPIFNKELEVNLWSLHLPLFFGRAQGAGCIPEPHPALTRNSHRLWTTHKEGSGLLFWKPYCFTRRSEWIVSQLSVLLLQPNTSTWSKSTASLVVWCDDIISRSWWIMPQYTFLRYRIKTKQNRRTNS